MRLKEDYFSYLKWYTNKHTDFLNQIFDAVIEKEVSDYPIMIFSDADIEIGLDIRKSETSGFPFLRISTLEEFMVKGMIDEDKVDHFKDIYKDPRLFYCVFAVKDDTGNFVFVPKQDAG